MYSYIYVSRFKQKAQGRRGRQGRSPTRQQFVLPAKADIGERIVGGRPPRGSEVETALTPLGSAPFTLLSEELSRLIRTSLHYASPKHAASPPSNVFNTQPNNSSSSGGGAAEVAAAAAAATAAAVSYCSHVLVPSTIFFFSYFIIAHLYPKTFPSYRYRSQFPTSGLSRDEEPPSNQANAPSHSQQHGLSL